MGGAAPSPGIASSQTVHGLVASVASGAETVLINSRPPSVDFIYITGLKPKDIYKFFTFPDTLIANQPIERDTRTLPTKGVSPSRCLCHQGQQH
jgi:hypothetical protein